MFSSILLLLLGIATAVTFFYWWERRRVFRWLKLKRDYNARLSRFPDADFPEVSQVVYMFSLLCDDLAMSRIRDYQRNIILAEEAVTLTEQLRKLGFFQKTDDLKEGTEETDRAKHNFNF